MDFLDTLFLTVWAPKGNAALVIKVHFSFVIALDINKPITLEDKNSVKTGAEKENSFYQIIDSNKPITFENKNIVVEAGKESSCYQIIDNNKPITSEDKNIVVEARKESGCYEIINLPTSFGKFSYYSLFL